MANKNETLIISGVTALYPKINQTYKFDASAGEKGRTVPCAPSDDGSEYTMDLVLTKAQAASLYGTMKSAYAAGKHEKWDDFPKASSVFKMGDEADTFTIETKLKGKFGTELTQPPKQFDANNQLMPADFLLTSGSKINVLVSLVPYEPVRGCGVSLRLRQVQVIELAELKQRSAFDVIEGGFNSTSDGFATELPAAAPTTEDDGFDMGTPAPAKPKAVKIAEAPVAVNDIDAALDDLSFDVPKAG